MRERSELLETEVRAARASRRGALFPPQPRLTSRNLRRQRRNFQPLFAYVAAMRHIPRRYVSHLLAENYRFRICSGVAGRISAEINRFRILKPAIRDNMRAREQIGKSFPQVTGPRPNRAPVNPYSGNTKSANLSQNPSRNSRANTKSVNLWQAPAGDAGFPCLDRA